MWPDDDDAFDASSVLATPDDEPEPIWGKKRRSHAWDWGGYDDEEESTIWG